MEWEIWANVPDQDHRRSWIKIGECTTLEQFDDVKEKYIVSWKPTSNTIRLRQPGSFEIRKKELNDQLSGTFRR
jgi:hypothetical protein